ncbi:branched-chain amino acid ABC transporter permease [Micromonospora sp. NPDC005087]|uniref:branched-chain amino acid ABC transporter permease n=1 Tax=Micromonospora sp. NPDC005087 TaxID=3364225 RepID=UPI00368DBA84
MLTTLLAGLSVGAVYALVAIGYNIVFIPSGVVNFAHAALIMVGTFVSYWGLATQGWPIWAVVPVVALVVGAIALVEERVAVRPIFGSGVHGELVTTLGAALLLEGIAVVVWGDQPLTVPVPGVDTPVSVFGGRAIVADLLLVLIAVALALGLHEWTRRSIHGLAGLAASEDRVAAMLRGVNVRRMTMIAFVISGLLAGALAPLMAAKTLAITTLGSALAVKGFVAFAVGGFGNIRGALVGGLLIGVVEATGQRYLGSQYAGLLLFALLLVLLLVRPGGLFVSHKERVV